MKPSNCCRVILAAGMTLSATRGETLILDIRDESTRAAVPARVYIQDPNGRPPAELHPPSAGTARYDSRDDVSATHEAYLLLAAGPQTIKLSAGEYLLTVERGKEYTPLTRRLRIVENQTLTEHVRLARRFNMAELGWYSADCHVHTPLSDLPLAQLADDVNVAFPITAWAYTDTEVPKASPGASVPTRGRVQSIDSTHVYWDLNTEYEIASVAGQPFVLGSLLILGHELPFELTAPPLQPVITEARRQGAIVDWEKHTWPWSLMLLGLGGIDAIELSNNSMWRQRTIYRYLWDRRPPSWIRQPLDASGFVEYGFEMYYLALNCGYRLNPSAGCANGVHPVPLGHSRVYARIKGDFSYAKWLEGFRSGRSFATNGPMLLMTIDDLLPGDRSTLESGKARTVTVNLEILTAGHVGRIELVVNGRVEPIPMKEVTLDADGRHARARRTVTIEGTSWIAARCWDRTTPEHPLFAHTGTVLFEDPSRPLHPEPRQLQYAIDTITQQIERSSSILSDVALEEYRKALDRFRGMKSQPPAP